MSKRTIVVLAALVLFLGALAGWNTAWRYDEVSLPEERILPPTGMFAQTDALLGEHGPTVTVMVKRNVRTHLVTGKVEVLSGSGWTPLDPQIVRQRDSDPSAPPPSTLPAAVDLPQKAVDALTMKGGVMGPIYGSQKFVLTVLNASEWEVTEISVSLDYPVRNGEHAAVGPSRGGIVAPDAKDAAYMPESVIEEAINRSHLEDLQTPRGQLTPSQERQLQFEKRRSGVRDASSLGYPIHNDESIPKLLLLTTTLLPGHTLPPGRSGTLETHLADNVTPTATWQVVGAKGIKRPRR